MGSDCCVEFVQVYIYKVQWRQNVVALARER